MSRGNRWVLPCVPLESGSSERGQAEPPLSILFSSDEDRACRTGTGRFTSSTSPDEGHHRKSLRLFALRVSRWINVRRGACDAQLSLRNVNAFFSIYLEGLATGACRWSPCGAWIVIISTVHALRRFLTTEGSAEWAMLATDQNCCQKNFV